MWSRRRSTSRIYNVDGLRMPRCWMWGPKWKRHFNVRAVPITDVFPQSAPYHRPWATVLVFTFEEDLREMILEEIRPGVHAMWSDPRERISAAAAAERPRTR